VSSKSLKRRGRGEHRGEIAEKEEYREKDEGSRHPLLGLKIKWANSQKAVTFLGYRPIRS
jgi:hypothetical protein